MARLAIHTPPREASAPRPRHRTRLAQRQARLAWLLLLPTLAVVVFVALYPLLRTIYDSFTDARLGSTRPVHVIGLRNYTDLLRDTAFRQSVWVSVKFAF